MRTLFSVAFYSLVFTLLLNNQVFASDDEFMEYDDFLFEVVDLVNKKVKVYICAYSRSHRDKSRLPHRVGRIIYDSLLVV